MMLRVFMGLLMLAMTAGAAAEPPASAACTRVDEQLTQVRETAHGVKQVNDALERLQAEGQIAANVDLKALFAVDIEDESAVQQRAASGQQIDAVLAEGLERALRRCAELRPSADAQMLALRELLAVQERLRQRFFRLPEAQRQAVLQLYRDLRWLTVSRDSLARQLQQLQQQEDTWASEIAQLEADVAAVISPEQRNQLTTRLFTRQQQHQALSPWLDAMAEQQQLHLAVSQISQRQLAFHFEPQRAGLARLVADDWLKLVLQGPWPQRNWPAEPPPAELPFDLQPLLDEASAIRQGVRLRLLAVATDSRSWALEQGLLRYPWQQLASAFATELAAIPLGLTLPFIPAYHQKIDNTASHSNGSLWPLVALSCGYVALLLLTVMLSLRSQYLVAHLLAWNARHSNLSSRLLHPLLSVLRANAVWLAAWLGFTLCYLLFQRSLPFVVALVHPVLMLYVGFRLVLTLGDLAWSRIYFRAGQYLNSAEAERLHRASRRFAGGVVLSQLVLAIVAFTVGRALLFSLLLSSLAFVLWALWVWSVRQELAVLQKAVLRCLPSALTERLPLLAPERTLGRWLAPLTTLWVLLADLLFAIHQRLLRFEHYQSLSARVLRLRLENSAAADDDEEIHSDASYEKIFVAKGSDSDLVEVAHNQRLEVQINRWRQGEDVENVLLLVGDKGSGKSTLCRQLASRIGNEHACHANVPAKCTSVDALWAFLSRLLDAPIDGVEALLAYDRQATKRVLILDEAQNFFLAEVGCLDAYRVLADCLNEHFENLYWLLAMNRQAWRYLSNVFGSDHLLADEWYMARWTQAEIRSLILGRHQRTGFRLSYDELLLSSITTSDTDARDMQTAEGRLFNLLWDQAGGNPGLAIRLWLSAATNDGRRRVEIGLPPRQPATLLRDLPTEHHFVLAAIVVHENLTVAELEQTTNLPNSRIRNALKAAVDEDLVLRSGDGRYRVAPLWYPPLLLFLIRKNYIHG